MDIITVAAQKGGVGKSHLVANLAVQAEQGGIKQVAILDLDPLQASITSWSRKRAEGLQLENPITLQAALEDMGDVVSACEEEGIDFLFIDTKAQVDDPVPVALTSSNYAIIPCEPSVTSMEGIGLTVAIAQQMRTPSCIVFNKGDTGSRQNQRVLEALQGYGMTVCPEVVNLRRAIRYGFDAGMTVEEYAPKDKAVGEIKTLWRWIEHQIRRDR